MRIAMLSWESLHSIAVGGVAAHVSELAEALAEKGHDIHVFTRIDSDQQPYEFIGLVHYHRCQYARQNEFVDDVNSMCRALAEHVFATEDYIGPFDIIHAHDWLAANAMIWIKQARGRRSILTIHSTEYGRCGNSFPDGRPARVREQERAGTYWADRVIAVSGVTRNEIAWMYNVPNWKAAVIHNGVQASRFESTADQTPEKARYNIGADNPTVLFCGRMAHQKGPDLLLEAIPTLLTHYPNAKFVYAGDGDMRWSLEERARDLGIEHAVRFIGYRNGSDMPRLYHMADIVCVPSRNEPFGIVVLEAWSAGKPVVVTQVGGPAEYVRHQENGLKVYPTTDSIAWGLEAMFMDFNRAKRMGRVGRLDVRMHFSWDQIAERTLNVYDPDHVPATNLLPLLNESIQIRAAANGALNGAHALPSPRRLLRRVAARVPTRTASFTNGTNDVSHRRNEHLLTDTAEQSSGVEGREMESPSELHHALQRCRHILRNVEASIMAGVDEAAVAAQGPDRRAVDRSDSAKTSPNAGHVRR